MRALLGESIRIFRKQSCGVSNPGRCAVFEGWYSFVEQDGYHKEVTRNYVVDRLHYGKSQSWHFVIGFVDMATPSNNGGTVSRYLGDGVLLALIKLDGRL